MQSLLARYNVAGPRYTSYPTAPEWKEDFGSDEYARHLRIASKDVDAPLSLYFHLPFCKSLCWYCGCNVVIAKEASAADRYLDHLIMEMDLAKAQLGQRKKVSQMHLGGGTPTFLTEEQLTRLWREVTARFDILPTAEVAIEVHPALTSENKLRVLRELGFNRVSMGCQDFDPQVQQATNRIQTYEQTRDLLNAARRLGFSGINFDLIYGLPHQTPESWQRTLAQVLSLRPDRLAVYSFAFMPDVLKHQKRMPAEAMPKGSAKMDLFLAAREAFMGAGYKAIGMDHFALPDDELSVAQTERRLGRNFQGYTVRAAGDVVAFGSTGISDVAGAYAQSVRALPYYYERIASGRFATERGITLTDDDVMRRRMIQQLMCNFWLDLGADDAFPKERERLQPMIEDGLVKVTGREVEVTPVGQLFVRNLAMAFDARLHGGGHTRFSQTV